MEGTSVPVVDPEEYAQAITALETDFRKLLERLDAQAEAPSAAPDALAALIARQRPGFCLQQLNNTRNVNNPGGNWKSVHNPGMKGTKSN